MKFEPAYLELFSTGELERRAEAAYRHLYFIRKFYAICVLAPFALPHSAPASEARFVDERGCPGPGPATV